MAPTGQVLGNVNYGASESVDMSVAIHYRTGKGWWTTHGTAAVRKAAAMVGSITSWLGRRAAAFPRSCRRSLMYLARTSCLWRLP